MSFISTSLQAVTCLSGMLQYMSVCSQNIGNIYIYLNYCVVFLGVMKNGKNVLIM